MIAPAVVSCMNTAQESGSDTTIDSTLQSDQTSAEDTEYSGASRDDDDTEDALVESDTDASTDYFEQITMTPETVSISFLENGEFLYRIVRDVDASMKLHNKITDLRALLKEATGKTVETITRSDITDFKTAQSSCDILIGNTGHVSSKILLDILGKNDYFVGAFKSKVIIIGGSEESTISALEYFIDEVISRIDADNAQCTVTMLSSYLHRHEYVGADMKIGSALISDCSLKYASGSITDESIARSLAERLQKAVGDYNGATLEVGESIKTESALTVGIFIGPVGHGYAAEFYSKNTDPMGYAIKVEGGKLYICGGGEWAIEHALDYVIDNYVKKGVSISNGTSFSGTIYGKQLFAFEKNSNLRIMANNVWSCDNNQKAWSDIGENCSAETRAKGLAACYLAFRPDVINFPEMTPKMLSLLLSNLSSAGQKYVATESINQLNIIYNTATLTLVEHGYHLFAYGNNSNSKGYAWALFEHKATGERFVSMSTHFWWKSESAEPGSNAHRENQAIEISEKCIELASRYNCPVFMGGDFNSRTSTKAMNNITARGIKNCFDTAAQSDNLGSHHSCGPDGFSRGGKGTNLNAIDHIFCYNLGDAKLNAFRRTQPYFFIKLSDHYPLYVDVTL